MLVLGRRTLLLGSAALAALGLAGCNGGGGNASGLTPDDMVLGSPDAPVTLVEYASTTCPHCAAFHADAFEQLKTNYIDTGRVRFVFREFPTPPPQIALAGFQVARCGGASPEQYFVRLSELFRQREAMFATGSLEGVRAKLFEVGMASGLSQEQINECINDPTGAERIVRITEAAEPLGVTGTPTFFINGERANGVGDYATLSRALDAALAS